MAPHGHNRKTEKVELNKVLNYYVGQENNERLFTAVIKKILNNYNFKFTIKGMLLWGDLDQDH